MSELEVAYNQLNCATSKEAIDRAIFRINMAEKELVIKRNNAKEELYNDKNAITNSLEC